MLKRFLSSILLICVLLIAFWIRTQGISRIPDGQFTGYDAYLYYWQANIISEHGDLPERDMHRWLPLGRDLGQTLNLYSFALAYGHKAISLCFPNVSLYHVSVYAPPICFVIGLGVLCLFLYHTYGLLFSGIVGVLLATFLGTIGRSSAGFGDRDSWCFMLAVLAATTYLASLQTQHPRKRILWSLASGGVVFLGGLSWEAFGFFVLMIVAVELWKFCTTDSEQHLTEYILWVFMFVPGLYLVSPAYRNGYGFAAHVTALLLFPPLVILGIRSVRYLLLDFFQQLRPYARPLAWLLTLSSIALGIIYLLINLDNFDHTAYQFSENRLMRSIGELANPRFDYWMERYGSFFILGSLGFVIESLRIWRWKAIPLAASLTLFFTTTFFRWPISQWIGTDVCNILFFASFALVPIGIGIASHRTENSPTEFVMLLVIAWALLWIGLARGGKRFDFFIGVPIAFGTASLLCHRSLQLIEKLKTTKRLPAHFKEPWVVACITAIVFIPLLLWAPLGGHATRALKNAKKIRGPIPGRGEVLETFQWMNSTLPDNSVMAAHWSHGSQLNIFGGVKTIIDQDHYLPHWIHLYYRHVFSAQSEREALSFLITHGATHLMLTQNEVIRLSRSLSFIGSDKKADRRFGLTKLDRNRKTATETYTKLLPRRGTPLESIEVVSITPEKRLVTIQFKTQDTVTKEVVWNANIPSVIELGTSGMILYFDFEGKPYIGYYISPIGWNSLAVKLFIRGEHSTAFIPVYPVNKKDFAKLKVWKIHYPSDIKPNPRYLATEP
ncbi:MAG: hypothetical protein OXH00_05450 [Candidatus Poribacteria bacterium]|nr:hypothetical protein [Candidatus Poribacteria bacterium]